MKTFAACTLALLLFFGLATWVAYRIHFEKVELINQENKK